MAVTVGNMVEFRKLLPKGMKTAQQHRQDAVEVYLATGGVTKFEPGDSFPKIIYPNIPRLESQIREAEERLKDYDRQIGDWHRRHHHLQTNKVTDIAARVADPLFWEHQAKLITDPAYRATYDLVKPPMHLVHKEKWRKNMKMFVRSKEYRLRLHEARTSKIGKKRLPMSEEVEGRLEFNRQLARIELDKLEKKRGLTRQRIDAMHTLLSWAKAES